VLDYAQSVLDLAAEQLAEVERLHDETLATGVPSGRMQALIKNVVENQRSVLDYTAQAVADKYACKTNPYWPAAKNPADFQARMNKELPGIVATHPRIAAAFERHQPYQPSHSWLLHLFALTRENKHHRLTAQVGGDELRPGVVRPSGHSRIVGPMVVRVRWDFVDPSVPVLDTLRQVQAGVQIAAEDVSSAAGL